MMRVDSGRLVQGPNVYSTPILIPDGQEISVMAIDGRLMVSINRQPWIQLRGPIACEFAVQP